MTDSPGARRFRFSVTATGTATLEAEHARQARDALMRALDGATATVVDGPGAGLRLVDVRASPDVMLIDIDGVDPTADLRRALGEHRRRTEDGDEPRTPDGDVASAGLAPRDRSASRAR